MFNEEKKSCGSLNINEDEFWSFIAPRYFKDFKVADFECAMYFSFETQPRRLYKTTNNKLPFGCHAWQKYDPEFWKEFIN